MAFFGSRPDLELGVARPRIGIIGASSLMGRLAAAVLKRTGADVIAFSRTPRELDTPRALRWQSLEVPAAKCEPRQQIAQWLCFAPVWTLPEHFKLLEYYAAKRIVAISSTSRFTKAQGAGSNDEGEHALAMRLEAGEDSLSRWALSENAEFVILRPTLVYGYGQDKNLTEIARFVRIFHCFPLLGVAKGLRQPVHADDVVDAAVVALNSPAAVNQAYNISGGETLSYRDMVTRVFVAMGRTPLLLPIPMVFFQVAVGVIRRVPKYRHWTTAMAERMNRDLVFDHGDATRDLGFKPRKFTVSPPATLPPT